MMGAIGCLSERFATATTLNNQNKVLVFLFTTLTNSQSEYRIKQHVLDAGQLKP